MPRSRPLALLAVASCLGLLSCAESSPPPPAAPTLSVDAGLKQLLFTWTAVSGADYLRLLVDREGTSSYEAVTGNLAATATSYEMDVSVHLQDWVRTRYAVEACNAGGCTRSAPVDAQDLARKAVAYVKSNPARREGFWGQAVTLSADGSMLASAFDDTVQVYSRDGGSWSVEPTTIAATPAQRGVFGADACLSADGNTLAVGAWMAESYHGSGRAYIYERSGGTWTLAASLAAPAGDPRTFYGRGVAISGDGQTVAVSAARAFAPTVLGAVYVFVRRASGWSQQAVIEASNGEVGDAFGYDIALSADGSTLAVGASGEDGGGRGVGADPTDNSASESGAVYVFARTGGRWSQEAYIKTSNAEAGDVLGGSKGSLAISDDGNTLAVGAYGEDSAATGVGGNEASNGAQGSGAVYVFTRGSSGWTQEAYVKASNTGAGDGLGWVALSGDGMVLAAGASGEASRATGVNGDQGNNGATDAGAVYVFRRSGATWTQVSYVKATNTGARDLFGTVALNRDGSVLAVGACEEDGGSPGVGGNQADNSSEDSGAIYLY